MDRWKGKFSKPDSEKISGGPAALEEKLLRKGGRREGNCGATSALQRKEVFLKVLACNNFTISPDSDETKYFI